MKVILLQHVKSVGKPGDVIEVSDGYARNFLLPKKLAVQASDSEMAKLKQKAVIEAKRGEKNQKESSELAKKLNGRSFEVSERVNEKGKLYAALTKEKICDILRMKKFDLNPKMIEIKDPIKETGTYQVVLNLSHGFKARITIKVTGK